MSRNGLIRIGFVILLLCVVAVAADAATYGYVVVKGKDEKALDREVATIERLITGWDKGEVLFKHKVTSGVVFFKRHAVTIFFAGYDKDISAFLSSGPYEGDFVRDVVVKFLYTSYRSPREAVPELVTALTRKFSNIRLALATIKGKTDTVLWNEFKTSKPKQYQSHLVDGKLIAPQINVVFYSLQPVEENRLLSLTFGEGWTRRID